MKQVTNIELLKKIEAMQKEIKELKTLVSQHEQRVIEVEGFFKKALGYIPDKYKSIASVILGREI